MYFVVASRKGTSKLSVVTLIGLGEHVRRPKTQNKPQVLRTFH